VYVHTECVTSTLLTGYVVTVDKRLMKDIRSKIYGPYLNIKYMESSGQWQEVR